MRFLPFLLLPLLPMSAQAITWKEFWQPFRYERPYVYRTALCDRHIYREEYVEGDHWRRGYMRRWTEVVQVPCGY